MAWKHLISIKEYKKSGIKKEIFKKTDGTYKTNLKSGVKPNYIQCNYTKHSKMKTENFYYMT